MSPGPTDLDPGRQPSEGEAAVGAPTDPGSQPGRGEGPESSPELPVPTALGSLPDTSEHAVAAGPPAGPADPVLPPVDPPEPVAAAPGAPGSAQPPAGAVAEGPADLVAATDSQAVEELDLDDGAVELTEDALIEEEPSPQATPASRPPPLPPAPPRAAAPAPSREDDASRHPDPPPGTGVPEGAPAQAAVPAAEPGTPGGERRAPAAEDERGPSEEGPVPRAEATGDVGAAASAAAPRSDVDGHVQAESPVVSALPVDVDVDAFEAGVADGADRASRSDDVAGSSAKAPAAGVEDMPAPAEGVEDMPARAAGVEDMPARAAGVEDMPAPAEGVEDMPAPAEAAVAGEQGGAAPPAGAPDEARADEARAGGARADEARAGEARADEARADEAAEPIEVSEADAETVEAEELVEETPPPVPGESSSSPAVAPIPITTALDDAVADAKAVDWHREAGAARVEVDAEKDRARGAILVYELGELCERRLHDEKAAVQAFGRALQLDPSLRPNLWAIRRVFYRRGLWPNLLKLLDAETRFARDDAERADLYLEKGRILGEHAKDREGAREAYERALALDPGHQAALMERERLALADKDTEALRRLWRALADAAAAPRRKAAYLVDLARLEADAGDEGCRQALALLDEAAALGVDRERVARERERIAARLGDDDALLAALEARIEVHAAAFGPGGPGPAAEGPSAGGGPLGKTERLVHEIAALRRRQAAVASARGAHEDAWRYLEQAIALAPSEPILLADLADLAEATGRYGDLADLCARQAAIEATTPVRTLALGLRRADALARAGRAEEAEGILDGLLAGAPGYLPVLALRERRALAEGEFARVASLLLAEAAAARLGTAFGPAAEATPDPSWAAAAYVAAGDVLALRLGQDEEARGAYGQALEALPGYWPAVRALFDLHARAGRDDEAAALLELQLEPLAARPEAAAQVEEGLEELARLYATAGKFEDELRVLLRLAELRPDDATLRWRIETLLATAGRSEERAALLERLGEKTDEPARQAAVFLAAARIHDEELGRPEAAAAMYRRALVATPGDRYARAALAALLRRTGRWEELAAERRAEAEALADGAAVVRALREAATILERKLGRAADAAGLYRDLCDRAPDDAFALRALAACLAGEPTDQAEVLEREIGVLPAGAARAGALLRLGELYESQGRADDAVAAYGRARDEGASQPALWALATMAAAARDGQALARALDELAAATADPDLKADLSEEAAWLVSADLEEARTRFEGLTTGAPDRRGAQLGRALVAARRRDAVELGDALSAQAERTSDPAVAAALLLRAAALAEVAGGDRAAALADRARALAPEHAGALLAATETGGGAGDDATGRADALARRAALVADPDLRAELHLERAERLEAQGRLAEAGRAVAAALEERRDHLGALQLLRRIARRGGDLDTLARASVRLAMQLREPDAAAELAIEAAGLLERDLLRPDDAGPVWRLVLEHRPADATAYARAREIFTSANDHLALQELISQRLRYAADVRAEIPCRLERAAVRRRLGNLAGAAADLERVLSVEPRHFEALSALADVRAAAGDARAAAALYARALQTEPDSIVAAPIEKRRALLLLEKLGDPAGALEALDRVLDADPADLEARERLIDCLAATEDHGRIVRELEELARRRTDAAGRAASELRAARIYLDELKDRAKGRAALERARQLTPLELEPVRLLCAIAEGGDREAVVAGALDDLRSALVDSPTDPSLFARIADVAALGEDKALAFAARGGMVLLGQIGASDEAFADHRRALVTAVPRPTRAIAGEEWRSAIEHSGLHGPLSEAWHAIADAVTRLGAHEPSALGFGRKDHVAAKTLAKEWPIVEAYARALGVGEIELYVGEGRAGFARALPLETPVVLVGADVARAATLEARFRLAFVLAAVRTRGGPLEELGLDALAIDLGAAVRVAGGDPGAIACLGVGAGGVTAAKIDERARGLGKTLSRKDRKALPMATQQLSSAGDLAAWRAAVRATAARAAFALTGDLPVAVEALAPGRDRAARLALPEVADLLTWSVSDKFTAVRKHLGL